MRALVTGATGFLGSAVVRQLLARGVGVVAFVRANSDRSRIDGLPIDCQEGDITDRASVERAMRGATHVFHCAAAVDFGPRDPTWLEQVNVQGSMHVLGAAAERGATVVHVSSLSAFGPTQPDAAPKDESWWSPAPPAVAYDASKRAAHEFARALARQGASVRIAAPGGIYGYGDRSLLGQVVRAHALWPLPFGYLPEVRQSIVNVDDCADALLRIADRGADGDEFLVVAEAVTVCEWLGILHRAAGRREPSAYLPTRWLRVLARPASTLARWLGQPPTRVTETLALLTRDLAYTGEKLRRTLGWTPRTLTEGMQQLVDALRAAEWRGRVPRR